LLTSRKVDRTHERWDEVLENIISDHERRSFNYGRGDRAEQEEGADFVDVMLSVQQEYGITRDHIKAVLMVNNKLPILAFPLENKKLIYPILCPFRLTYPK